MKRNRAIVRTCETRGIVLQSSLPFPRRPFRFHLRSDFQEYLCLPAASTV